MTGRSAAPIGEARLTRTAVMSPYREWSTGAADAEIVRIDLHAAVRIEAVAIFGIDVDRLHQPVLPECAIGAHGAAHAPQPDRGNLHGSFPCPDARLASTPGGGGGMGRPCSSAAVLGNWSM